MKTRVEILHDDAQHNNYKRGELGYIDGYVAQGSQLFAVVVKDESGDIVFIKPHVLKAFGFYSNEDTKII